MCAIRQMVSGAIFGTDAKVTLTILAVTVYEIYRSGVGYGRSEKT